MSVLRVVALSLLTLFAGAAYGIEDLQSIRATASEGRPGAALKELDSYLAARPGDVDALFLKGVLLVELRRAEEARQIFEDLIAARPELPEPYNNLAVIEAASGDYEGAVETLKRSIQTHASYGTAYENLTKIYTQLASAAYARALEDESAQPPEVVELVLLGRLETAAPEAGAAAGELVAEAAAEPEAVEMVPAPASPAPPPAAPAAPQPPAPAIEQEDLGPDMSAIAPFVESWAAAWREQRVDEYLGSYSRDFKPEGELSRADWATQRRIRVRRPRFIKLSIAFLGEPTLRGETATVQFIQSYESDTFSDTVTKTLELLWEDGGWKIRRERVEP